MKKPRILALAAGTFFLILLAIVLSNRHRNSDPPRLLRPLFDFLPHETIYALCMRDIEFVFFVHDAVTGEPVAGAELTIRDEKDAGDGKKIETKLITDESGRVRLLRENSDCEEVIRTFRKTVTLFNSGWCDFDVQAENYQPIKNANLLFGSFAHEDKGYSQQEHIHRVEYKIPVTKKN
jgi:hypothetical protein